MFSSRLLFLACLAGCASASTTGVSHQAAAKGRSLPAAVRDACEGDAETVQALALLQGTSRRTGASALSEGHAAAKQSHEEASGLELPLPELTAVSRTFYSSNPKASADFWLRYIKGTRKVDSWLKADASCLETEAVELEYRGEKMNMIFVKDKMKPSGPVSLDEYVDSSDREWAKVMDRTQNYSPWVDFHDGMTWSIFNLEAMADDHVPFQRYTKVLRFNIPHTAWTLELVQLNTYDSPDPDIGSIKSLLAWNDATYDNPDKCRNIEAVNTTHMWWKATFGATDPEAALEFSKKVLGAFHVDAPYPWPPRENCTAAIWVRLPTTDGSHGMEFHFVQSLEYPPGSPSISSFNDYQGTIRDLKSGIFDRYLYNSLVLKADSLDPFIQRLRSVDCPFLLLQMDKLLFSLYFSFPGNEAIVMQIQSSHVALAEPTPFSACTQS